MRFQITAFLGAIFAQFAMAATEAEVISVVRLADKVKVSAATTEATSTDIQEAEKKLLEVIEILELTGKPTKDTEFTLCYEFAYSKYYTGFNSTEAADKATRACKGKMDVEVAKYLYSKHYTGFNSVEAMDKAFKDAGKRSQGKLPIIEFLYSKIYTGFNSSEAASKAAEAAAQLNRRDGLACLQKVYPNYYTGFNAIEAADKSVKACSGQ